MFARKFRVDDPEDKYKDKMIQWITQFSSHLLVQERTPKIHYHGYFMAPKTTQAYRTQIIKLGIEKGNRGHSFSETHHDWPFYLGYIQKENLPGTLVSHNGLEHPPDYYYQYYLKEKTDQIDKKEKRREQDRHHPVWETVYKYLQETLPPLPP